ncbi:MAG TPA: hypothetical protein VJH97_02520 [Candidatus Nanoarchaeia archaeon]|nr:hypothetical protein [Candidatus Nanoarchaeia archaeon]
MKNEKTVLYGILILLIIAFLATFGLSDGDPSPTAQKSPPSAVQKSNSPQSNLQTISTGDTSPGGVSIDLTPTVQTDGKLRVELSANTHSVDLSQFDLKEITTLGYNEKTIKPVSAPALNGHHVSGDLIFEVGEDIKSFKITIQGIPLDMERIFEW